MVLVNSINSYVETILEYRKTKISNDPFPDIWYRGACGPYNLIPGPY
jgi:hypothetical protein